MTKIFVKNKRSETQEKLKPVLIFLFLSSGAWSKLQNKLHHVWKDWKHEQCDVESKFIYWYLLFNGILKQIEIYMMYNINIKYNKTYWCNISRIIICRDILKKNSVPKINKDIMRHAASYFRTTDMNTNWHAYNCDDSLIK